MSSLESISYNNKTLQFPTFFPDATRGVIRGGVDSADLVACGVEGLIVNTYHLMSQPGATVVKQAGGIKQFMHWDGWIISDSGGFQLLSLIYRDSSFGTITDKGVHFKKGSKGDKRSYEFTPEKSIQTQFSIGSDIMICLDDCPALSCSVEENKASVDRTILWARRCKEEFEKQCANRRFSDDTRPLLFGVIQGGDDPDERKRCADALLEMGFDGYGFGGWPLNTDRNLNTAILQLTADLMPDDKPKYALGVGNPQAIVDCRSMGYDIFDCVLPTRDARHRRLYEFNTESGEVDVNARLVHKYVYILEEKYVRDARPISEACDCFTCQNYSRSYLHHLFKIEDALALRLATIHNLRMYERLIESLRISSI